MGLQLQQPRPSAQQKRPTDHHRAPATMASSLSAPKGILKKTSQPQQQQQPVDNTMELPAHLRDLTSTLPSHLRAADPQHLATALHHASQIQLRKDLENLILNNLEALLEFPTTSQPAASPSEVDVYAFKELISPFQPSDYDSLIEERNINNQCGYTLCPKPCPPQAKPGGYRLFGGNGPARDFKIVKAKDVGRWCSEDCTRRALYIKVQLSEMPAWERPTSAEIELYGEREARSADMKRADALAEQVERLEIAPRRNWEQDLEGERPENGRNMAERLGLVKEEVVEKNDAYMRRPLPPRLDDEEMIDGMRGLHLVEGYATRFNAGAGGNGGR